jgi:hypothetical protein
LYNSMFLCLFTCTFSVLLVCHVVCVVQVSRFSIRLPPGQLTPANHRAPPPPPPPPLHLQSTPSKTPRPTNQPTNQPLPPSHLTTSSHLIPPPNVAPAHHLHRQDPALFAPALCNTARPSDRRSAQHAVHSASNQPKHQPPAKPNQLAAHAPVGRSVGHQGTALRRSGVRS